MKNISNLIISRAVPDDAEGIQTLIKEASRGMYELCGWSQKDINDHFSPEKMKEGIDKSRESIANFTDADILFIAKDEGGKVVGCCFAEKGDDHNKIEAAFVSPEYQGLGLGSKLYEKAYESLDAKNDTVLDVFSLNSKAIDFYKSLGFVETNKKSFDERFVSSTGKQLEIIEMKLFGKRLGGR